MTDVENYVEAGGQAIASWVNHSDPVSWGGQAARVALAATLPAIEADVRREVLAEVAQRLRGADPELPARTLTFVDAVESVERMAGEQS